MKTTVSVAVFISKTWKSISKNLIPGVTPGVGRRAHHGIPTHAQQSREEDGHLATASGGCPAGTTGKILDAPTSDKRRYIYFIILGGTACAACAACAAFNTTTTTTTKYRTTTTITNTMIMRALLAPEKGGACSIENVKSALEM